jgi:REP element-mobilizing transposase RayT
MARIPRRVFEDGIHHVTTRAIFGSPLFLDDVDREDLIRRYVRTERRREWLCHAWCLMDTHYHFILQTTIAALSAGMHWLNCGYARDFNKRHGRRGHVFDGRFRNWVIRDDEHYDRACEYVLTNPERAGIVGEWPWRGLGWPG